MPTQLGSKVQTQALKDSEAEGKGLKPCLKMSSSRNLRVSPASGSSKKIQKKEAESRSVKLRQQCSIGEIELDEVLEKGNNESKKNIPHSHSRSQEKIRYDRQGQPIQHGEQYSISFKKDTPPKGQISIAEKIRMKGKEKDNVEFAKPKQKKPNNNQLNKKNDSVDLHGEIHDLDVEDNRSQVVQKSISLNPSNSPNQKLNGGSSKKIKSKQSNSISKYEVAKIKQFEPEQPKIQKTETIPTPQNKSKCCSIF